jgi:GNAT superfamily N-acetyltransferase
VTRPSYDIVRYEPRYRDQVLAVQHHLWGTDSARNDQYLAWKYEQNPYADAPLIYLALDEGQVVAMRGMFGTRWQVGDPPDRPAALFAGDTVVMPDHRGRGLFRQIMLVALKDLARLGYRYLLNLSAGRATHLMSCRMGWVSIGPLERLRWRGRAAARRDGRPHRTIGA